jgi:hypothetical protein
MSNSISLAGQKPVNTQAKKLEKLKAGKSKAKASFDANALRELAVKYGNKTLILSHADTSNFKITYHDKDEGWFGTLGSAIRSMYIKIHGTNDYPMHLLTFIENKGYDDVKPSMPCSLIDVEEIRKEVLV